MSACYVMSLCVRTVHVAQKHNCTSNIRFSGICVLSRSKLESNICMLGLVVQSRVLNIKQHFEQTSALPKLREGGVMHSTWYQMYLKWLCMKLPIP